MMTTETTNEIIDVVMDPDFREMTLILWHSGQEPIELTVHPASYETLKAAITSATQFPLDCRQAALARLRDARERYIEHLDSLQTVRGASSVVEWSIIWAAFVLFAVALWYWGQ